MKTAIMTDTNSGITVQKGKEDGIFVLPMPVIVDNKDYLEGIDITHEDLYAAMRDGKDIHSSQPAIGAVSDMWDDILKQGYDEILYIPMSSGLSSSCEMAMGYAQKYNGKVLVADNHRISFSLYESVYDAKSYAQKGKKASEIKDALEKNAYNASIYITVNSLEYLKKSGRVTSAGAAIATVINLKPVLTIQGEKLDAYAKVRGMNTAKKKMLQALEEDLNTRFKDVPKEKLQLATAGTFEHKEDAEAWLDEVNNAFPGFEPYYLPLSCSIACHVGIDSVGTAIAVKDR
ncbi:MAG: DegV family protein [Lachnospiraceae bacterium]|nr:DegV family protein [Lachnospiraceae bacterium]